MRLNFHEENLKEIRGRDEKGKEKTDTRNDFLHIGELNGIFILIAYIKRKKKMEE